MPTALTPEERIAKLRERLSGTTSTQTQSKADLRLQANRPANLLYGVSLHAASRHAKGLPLSPLEQKLVGTLQKFVPNEEIAQYGQVYTEMKKSGQFASNILPEPVSRIDEETAYTKADFLRDAKALAPEIIAMPGNAIVDISSQLGSGVAVNSTEATSGVVVFTAPRSAAPTSTYKLRCKLQLTSFYCKESSGDGAWPHNSDELYWCTSAGADSGAERSHRTSEFGNLDSGDTRGFAADAVLFEGDVQDHVAGHIQCWEADDSGSSFYNDLSNMLKDTAQWCIDAAVDAAEADDWGDHQGGSDRGAALLALVAIVGGLVAALLDLLTNDDDLVCERTVGWTREGLDAMYSAPNTEIFMMFDGGGDGKHELRIRQTFREDLSPQRVYFSTFDGSTWSPRALVGNNMESPNGMTMANHLGTLFAVHRGLTGLMYVNKLSMNFGWTMPVSLSFSSPSRPGLCVFNNRLHCLYQDSAKKVYCATADLSLTTPLWASSPVSTTAETSDGPAAAGFGDKIITVIRGTDNVVYWNQFNGSEWSVYTKSHGQSFTCGSPALAVYRDELHLCIRGMDNGLYWSKYNGSTWTEFSKVRNFQIISGPSLAVCGDKMYVAMRSPGNQLWYAALEGSAWSEPHSLSGQFAKGEAGLGAINDKLYIAYADE